MRKNEGFTLLEILIALFIFTILSLIFVHGLRIVIDTATVTDSNSQQLRQLQITMLMMSRDIEQAIDRPIINAKGEEEKPFIGTPHQMTFTHLGFADPTGFLVHSALERTAYNWQPRMLQRWTWFVLDQAPTSVPDKRTLLDEIIDAHFEYLDQNGKFHSNWPQPENAQQTLPIAVKIELTLSKWGKMTQLFLIPAKSMQALYAPSNP